VEHSHGKNCSVHELCIVLDGFVLQLMITSCKCVENSVHHNHLSVNKQLLVHGLAGCFFVLVDIFSHFVFLKTFGSLYWCLNESVCSCI